MEEYIELKNVTKFYKMKTKRNYILKNCSIKIPANVNIGLLGRNGAGKSTLLRMLGGIENPNKGKIILPNKTFSWPMALSGGFQGSLSGKDNVKFVARIYGYKEEELDNLIQEIKDFSELGDFFYEPIKTYSSGMKAKLAFGLSTAIKFNYYLIDETLSVGDRRFKDKCQLKINELKSTSKVIVVSHDLSVLREMCDIIIMVEEKKLKIYNDIDEAIEVYNKM
jgi:capsular polysaccharide transport system ATP-binding protein